MPKVISKSGKVKKLPYDKEGMAEAMMMKKKGMKVIIKKK